MNLLMISGDRSVAAGEQGPFHNTLEGLSQHFERVDVIGRRPQRREREVVFGNVHLHYASTGKAWTPLYVRSKAIELVRAHRHAVATSQDDSPFLHALGAHALWRATGIPVLSELHHVRGHPRAADARERFDLALTRRYLRWAMRWVAGFRVVNAREMPQLLESCGVPRERIHVLPSLYIDLETFRPEPTRALEVDLAFCGRLTSNKGVLDLLEAVRRLVEAGRRQLRVELLGRGELEREIDAFVARHSLGRNVKRTAWLATPAEVAELYRKSRVVVCASYSEGGPRFAAEALACGTPVISTRVGAMPELIAHGETGYLYDGAVGELTALIARVLDDPRHRAELSANLVARAPIARYERTRVLAELAAGIRRVAESRGTR